MKTILKLFLVLILLAPQFTKAEDAAVTTATTSAPEPLKPIARPDVDVKYPEDVDVSGRVIDNQKKLNDALTELNFDYTKVNFNNAAVFCQPKFVEGYDAFYKCQLKAIIREKEFVRDSQTCSSDAKFEYPENLVDLSDKDKISQIAKAHNDAAENGQNSVKIVIDDGSGKFTKKI